MEMGKLNETKKFWMRSMSLDNTSATVLRIFSKVNMV